MLSDDPVKSARVPLATLLPDATVDALDEGVQARDAFILLKCSDEAGEPTWSFRTTGPMNLEELLGALEVQSALLRRKLVRAWEDED